jgi:hypothetical protein
MTPSTPPSPTRPSARPLGAAAAVAHPHQEVDDQALEERRTKGMDPLDDLAP